MDVRKPDVADGADGAGARAGGTARRDIIAGLTTGIANMPDAMASALLAGVSPITGLYALMAGTPIAGLLTGSVFLNASATSAMALALGELLAPIPAGPDRDGAMATVTLCIGAILLVAGLLRAGRLLRFVSNAVMTGFLTGVSILIVLSQLGDLTGFDSDLSNKVLAAVDLFLHPGAIVPTVLATGLVTIVVILLADRTPLRAFSMLIGIVAGSTLIAVLGWSDVPTVADIADIPSSLPIPSLPDHVPGTDLLLGAAAIAVIAMVQGAGVSKGYRNPDGHFADPSRDFVGVGAGNVASGLVGGLAIGGSVGSTALNVSAGAASRLANVVSGLVVVAAVLLLAGLVGRLALPSMAALLVVAGVQSIKVAAIRDVWEVGVFPRAVMVATVVLTLALPVQQAVLVGVVLSALAVVLQASADVRVVAIVPGTDPRGAGWAEAPAPRTLPDGRVTVVQILGSLSFAAADRVLELLPDPSGSRDAVVVIRLRQHVRLNSTLMVVLERYLQRVERSGGRVLLSGVGDEVVSQLTHAASLMPGLAAEQVYPATADLGPSTADAVAAGEAWIARRRGAG